MINNSTNLESIKSPKDQELSLSSLSLSENYCSFQNQSELVLNNFMFEISEYLNKKEKINLREINKRICKESASEFQINLNFKGYLQ